MSVLARINALANERHAVYVELGKLIHQGDLEERIPPLVARLREIEREMVRLWEQRRWEKGHGHGGGQSGMMY